MFEVEVMEELFLERHPSESGSSWMLSSWSGLGRRRCWVETRKEGMEVMLFWSSLREFILLPRQFSTVMSDLDRFLVRFMVRLLMDLCIIVSPVLE